MCEKCLVTYTLITCRLDIIFGPKTCTPTNWGVIADIFYWIVLLLLFIYIEHKNRIHPFNFDHELLPLVMYNFIHDGLECFKAQVVGNKGKGRISKWMLKENKACQVFRKMNISYPLIHTRTFTYQGVRNVYFSENLVCFVFL